MWLCTKQEKIPLIIRQKKLMLPQNRFLATREQIHTHKLSSRQLLPKACGSVKVAEQTTKASMANVKNVANTEPDNIKRLDHSVKPLSYIIFSYPQQLGAPLLAAPGSILQKGYTPYRLVCKQDGRCCRYSFAL